MWREDVVVEVCLSPSRRAVFIQVRGVGVVRHGYAPKPNQSVLKPRPVDGKQQESITFSETTICAHVLYKRYSYSALVRYDPCPRRLWSSLSCPRRVCESVCVRKDAFQSQLRLIRMLALNTYSLSE